MKEQRAKEIKEYAGRIYDSLLETLKALCKITAPSHFEHERAEFCKNFLEEHGAKGVYIDEALNIIFPLGY